MTQPERDLIDARFALVDAREQILVTMQDALTYRSCFICAMDLLFEKDVELHKVRRQIRELRGFGQEGEQDADQGA